MTLAYVLAGKPFTMMGHDFPASPETRAACVEWLKFVPTLIGSGKLIANPIWEQTGGLAKVNEGLNLVKEGKVRHFYILNDFISNIELTFFLFTSLFLFFLELWTKGCLLF